MYDQRVNEAVAVIRETFPVVVRDESIWPEIKIAYIGLLHEHRQPECAETFFNSVCCKILHRSYFNNDFIFVRPALSTEYIENGEPAAKPTYRAYYPAKDGLAALLEPGESLADASLWADEHVRELPKTAPWREDFTAELLAFPGRHDDQVDALTQGLAWGRYMWSRRARFDRRIVC